MPWSQNVYKEDEPYKDFAKSDDKKNKYIFYPQDIKPDEVTRLALRTEVNFESVCRKVRLVVFFLFSFSCFSESESTPWEKVPMWVGAHAFAHCVLYVIFCLCCRPYFLF